MQARPAGFSLTADKLQLDKTRRVYVVIQFGKLKREGQYTMNKNEVLSQLEALGTEQNRKIYKRHGIRQTTYGVSFANLGALKKKIKVDHALAQELWATGNHDARVLATMIADPAKLGRSLGQSVTELCDDGCVCETGEPDIFCAPKGGEVGKIESGRLEKKTLPVAQKIGVVEIDHGETYCKTPDAVLYIKKARARKK